MQALEQVIDYEKEADILIEEARKKAYALSSVQEEEIKKIYATFEERFVREKEGLRNAQEQKLHEIDGAEAQKRDELLKKIQGDFSNHSEKAVKIVMEELFR